MPCSVLFNIDERRTMSAVFPSRKRAIEEIKALVSDFDTDTPVTVTEPFGDGVSLIVKDAGDGETMHIVGTLSPTGSAALWTFHEK